MSIDAMKQALEALECIDSPLYVREINKVGDAITALRAAIEQAQKPVAWMRHVSAVNQGWDELSFNRAFDNDTPLYTAPRQWQGLTDEELKPAIQKAMLYYGHNPDHWALTAGAGFCILARAIEAKLREKNS